MRRLLVDHALLPDGWAEKVLIDIEGPTIVAVTRDATDPLAEHHATIALPGVPNLHSHAFQRALAGRAERGAPGHDDFWTWREVMYRFLATLTPDDVEAIAAYAYMRMLEAGITTVGEFHYLHHGPDGRPYSDLAELSARIISAATAAGIGLALLPCFYAHSGFGGAPPNPGQRRFITTPDQFLALRERCTALLSGHPAASLGIAPHSLRAVAPDELLTLMNAAPQGPIHIHAAEQLSEVEACLAWSGRRPVEWLLERAGVDARWTLIHATHASLPEVAGLARSGAVAGLCPITEADLGDGIFPGVDYTAMGGRFGIGTDSNLATDPAVELRQLEFAQRLQSRGRAALATEAGGSVGRRLLDSALAGGGQALAQPIGRLAPNYRADFITLRSDHPDMVGRSQDEWLDAWIFVDGQSLIDRVVVAGVTLVEGGVHIAHRDITQRYSRVMAHLIDRP